MIVEREIEIEKFITKEYWHIEADCNSDKQEFKAKLTQLQGEKVSQFSITNEADAATAVTTLQSAAGKQLQVVRVEKKQRKRNPAAPFTTSTLQQEAARKLGFTTKRTMRIAQQLYEGIDTGGGAAGLISYMRTDSVNLAEEALAEIREVIAKRFGADKLPPTARHYKTKAKNAQEAHEAIRPTSADRDPDSIKDALNQEQYKLYELIWKRTLACQMNHATIDTVAADMAAGDASNLFRATGSTIVDPGFMAVYQEGFDDPKEGDEEGAGVLPPLKEGQIVALNEIRPLQHFTEPPPRFSEASLVRALEEHGIGRPSTYAAIIATLQDREYVTLDKKRFKPTDVGRIVNKFLTEYFRQYVDYDFTANLEDQLDAVSRGEKDWVPVIRAFWSPFKELVDSTEKNVQRKDVTQEAIDENCPKCGKQLSIRLGKRGRFVGCSGYPECDFTRNLEGDAADGGGQPEVVEGRTCPDCNSPLVLRMGRYGKFIGCSNYPTCKHIEPLDKPADTGVQCPECKQGQMLKRRSRYGKIFYSCSRYPDCKYAVWNEPIAEECPKCHWPVLTIKTTKRHGTQKVCPQKECGHAQDMVEEAPAEETKT